MYCRQLLKLQILRTRRLGVDSFGQIKPPQLSATVFLACFFQKPFSIFPNRAYSVPASSGVRFTQLATQAGTPDTLS